MRKLAAILMLGLFVFNTVGYRLLIEYAQNLADVNLESRLDNGHYNPDQLVTVKIPLNLPYQNNWVDFERVNGEMNVNGIIYKYVQRKVYNDTLILQCIPHEEKTEIQKKANDYFGKVNDLPGNDNGSKKADAFKQLFSDYDVNTFTVTSYRSNTSGEFNLFKHPPVPQQYLDVTVQPPESNS